MTKSEYSPQNWIPHHQNTFKGPNPPARPISPFIPRNLKQAINLFKILSSLGFSLLSRKAYIWGQPIIAHIEPTSLCNLRCPLCPSGNKKLTRKRANMSLEDFKFIFNKLPNTVKMLLLWNQGEPFLIKDLVKMIRYAKRRDNYIVTSTNGHFFRDVESVEEIINSGIDEIIISLDGTNQQVYEKYRRGGRIDWVFDGIKLLANSKHFLQSHTPLIHLQFILMRQNAHQKNDMIKLGKKLGADRLSFKTLQITNFNENEDFIPDNPEFTRYHSKMADGKYITRKRRYFPNDCLRLWYSTVINCDGRISPCCFDKDGEYALGNLKEDPFDKIWKGNKYQNFRNYLLHKRYNLEMCQDCTEGVKELFIETIDYNK